MLVSPWLREAPPPPVQDQGLVWRERAPASAFYIIASGSIELRQRQPSMEGEATRDVSVCKPGDLIGHAALVLRPRGCPIKRQCVAMAAERTWLLGVSRPDLEVSRRPPKPWLQCLTTAPRADTLPAPQPIPRHCSTTRHLSTATPAVHRRVHP